MNVSVLFASNNENKLREVRSFGMDVVSLREAGIDVDPEETGSTFAENARLKARAVAQFASPYTWILADDSGLEVDALNNEPGIYSRRWASHAGLHVPEGKEDEVNDRFLLEQLDEVTLNLGSEPRRTATYACAMALLSPQASNNLVDVVVAGYWRGEIARVPRGSNGFAYDRLFVPLGGNFKAKTVAEMSEVEKLQFSHRSQALHKVRALLEALGG